MEQIVWNNVPRQMPMLNSWKRSSYFKINFKKCPISDKMIESEKRSAINLVKVIRKPGINLSRVIPATIFSFDQEQRELIASGVNEVDSKGDLFEKKVVELRHQIKTVSLSRNWKYKQLWKGLVNGICRHNLEELCERLGCVNHQMKQRD
jgi:DNA-binding Xre family transcriptional regulator